MTEEDIVMIQRARSTYRDNATRLTEDAMSADPGRLAQAPQAMLEAAAEAQKEVLSFMAMRLQKDSDAVREMTSCRSVTDVVQLQFAWMQEAMQDYGEETRRMIARAAGSTANHADRKGR
jgi:hypothetical protein